MWQYLVTIICVSAFSLCVNFIFCRLAFQKGFTPLHIAAKYGNAKVTKLLLQKNGNPNVEGKNGLAPLHVATHYNNAEVAEVLLENGANVHAVAKVGLTLIGISLLSLNLCLDYEA